MGHALVDTGADITLMPLEVARLLKVPLDDTEPLRVSGAGAGEFIAYPSLHKVEYAIERKAFRPIRWEGTVYFADSDPLLGHRKCLEFFDLTFHGPEKKLSVLPRF
jgi:hypothetical protein